MFRWIEHTGELELEIETRTPEDVFADALTALAELLGDGVESAPQQRRLTVRADDPPALLAAWLDELVYLAETEGFVPERVEELDLNDATLRALVRGRQGEPAHLVKAVTYHRLEFGGRAGGWRARVVLDV